MSDADSVVEPVQINIPPMAPEAPVKKTRKPRAKKVEVKKVRRVAKFHILAADEGSWTDTGVDAGTTYESAMRILKQMDSGNYWIVRDYGVKAVKITMTPKVTVE
jgi:hypothetical protein